MYGAGNPQMAALGALGALGGTLRDLAMSPVRRWGQASFTHKIIAAGAGAGLAYYLHKKGMADVAVAVVGLGGAYATSMLMHSREVVQTPANGAALPNGQPVAGALPAAQVQSMAEQAAAVMNGQSNGASNGLSGQWGALAAPQGVSQGNPQSAHQGVHSAPVGAQPQPQPQPQPVGAPPTSAPSAPRSGGGSKWAALG
jgi:hypothetical protein